MTEQKRFIDRIRPAPVNGGFRMKDHWVWCGSVARDDDGRFHMFASMWSKKAPFNPNWLTNSRVVRAVSDTPEGPYEYAEDVLPPRGEGFWDGKMTHNPTIHRSGDTWLLYYTGTTYDGPVPEAPLGTDIASWGNPRANQRIGLASAPSPEGPWTRYDEPVLPPRPGKWDGLMTTNPAPCVLEDGRVLLLYKAIAHDKSPLQYGAAMAESWDGEYRRMQDDPVFQFDDPTVSYEDAYVWREGGRFHMLFNDLTGKVTGEDHAGAHCTSEDGVRWDTSDLTKGYSRRIVWDDGTETVQGSFERPQILMQDGVSTHLFAATGDGPGGFWRAEDTWNMVVPLGPWE